MKATEGQSSQLPTQEEGRSTEEVAGLAKEQARKKVYAVQEQKIAEDLKAREARDRNKRAAGEPKRVAKEEARKKAYAAHEQKVAEGLKARKDRESGKR